jgi:hypothetical protein
LVQQRRLRQSVFETILRQVVRALEEQLAKVDRIRWLELLSYLSALIYHERKRPEQEPMWLHRREVFDMGQTMAEYLMEQGAAREAARSRQEILLRQLRVRFHRVCEGVVRRVENTTDLAQLDAWLDALAKARKRADVSIPPLKESDLPGPAPGGLGCRRAGGGLRGVGVVQSRVTVPGGGRS